MQTEYMKLEAIKIKKLNKPRPSDGPRKSVLEERMSVLFQDGTNAAALDVYRVHRESSQQEQIQMVNSIRLLLLSKSFPYPHWVKKLAWIVLLLGSAGGVFSAILYGLQFDLSYEFVVSRERQLCWENDMKEVLNEEYTDYFVNEKKGKLVYLDAYTDNITDSNSWILSLLESFVLSLLLSQPLTIWVFTWIKLCAFANNLDLDDGFGNLIALFDALFCCCFWKRNKNDADPEEMAVESQRISATGAPGRQLDVYGFYGNPELLIMINEEDHLASSGLSALDIRNSRANLLSVDQEKGLRIPSSSDELSYRIVIDPPRPSKQMQDIPMEVMVANRIEIGERKYNDEYKDYFYSGEDEKQSHQQQEEPETVPSEPSDDDYQDIEEDAVQDDGINRQESLFQEGMNRDSLLQMFENKNE